MADTMNDTRTPGEILADAVKLAEKTGHSYITVTNQCAERIIELLNEHEELKRRHKILVKECDKMYSTLKEKNKTIESLEDDLATTKDMLNHYLNGNE